MRKRLIAFYLPQFHPIPENDKWWGRGFTEWTNVAQAKPLFNGHYQPQIPADLGFYDLRLPEAREAQVELAKEYGVYGFCYYHYWFNGKRLLQRPFEEVLSSGRPDFPFCLCWANENWTKAWDGSDHLILAEQKYSPDDDRAHIRLLAKAFSDPRYIRHDGRPLFLVYRASNLPSARQTTEIWREEAIKLGIGEIFLCRVESGIKEKSDPKELGFDCSVEFQPDWSNLGSPRVDFSSRLLKRFGISNGNSHTASVYDYAEVVERMLTKIHPPYEQIRCVTPAWDNSPRRKKGPIIIHGATPELYAKWLRAVLDDSSRRGASKDFVFINGWNEWAEGNHLEPCLRWGRAFLEATKQALDFNPGKRQDVR